MAELTTAEKLVEAERAYHEIMSGQAVNRFVDQNGEQIQYSRANVMQLRAYIAELKALLAGDIGLAYRGPIRFTYGPRTYRP